MLQPPLSFLFEPPLEGINELSRVGDFAATPLIPDLPLLVPAALIDRLLNTADVLVVANPSQPTSPLLFPLRRPILGDEIDGTVILPVGSLPQPERALIAFKRR